MPAQVPKRHTVDAQTVEYAIVKRGAYYHAWSRYYMGHPRPTPGEAYRDIHDLMMAEIFIN
jgi:hypothetical protein